MTEKLIIAGFFLVMSFVAGTFLGHEISEMKKDENKGYEFKTAKRAFAEVAE